jgi:hypothetical protein
MAYTLLAYAAAAQGISATLAALPSISDQSLRQNGNGYIVPLLTRIPFVFAFGPTMTRAQIKSTTLAQLALQEIEPINIAFPAASQWPSFANMVGAPLQLSPSEELDVLITNTAADGEYVLVWLSDGPLVPLPFFYGAVGPAGAGAAPGASGLADIRTGQPFSVRATAATTLVIASWALATLTMDQNLIPGHYQLIGARARSANIIGFRVQFPGYAWRPGGLGNRGTAGIVSTTPDIPQQRMGGWGVWGEFDSIQLPAIEVISNVADTVEQFVLDLIRVGPITSLPH